MDLLPGYQVWYFNLVASLVITSIFAWLSWTLVESKALAWKRQATRFVDSLCTRITQLWRNRWTLPRAGFQTGAD